MGWWSVQRSDYRSPLVELANTTISFKGSTKKRTIVLAQAASPSIFGAFTHFLNVDARCGSKPTPWRCRVFFAKAWIRHDIPEEPAFETRHECLCFDGPTEKKKKRALSK
jgi:hypothetical protein